MRGAQQASGLVPVLLRSLYNLECIQNKSPVCTRYITQLSSLTTYQHQQVAGYAAYKKPPEDGDENGDDDVHNAGRKGHLPRISTSSILHQFSPERVHESLTQQETKQMEERQGRIKDLLQSSSSGSVAASAAATFMDEYFSAAVPSPSSNAPDFSSLLGEDISVTAEQSQAGLVDGDQEIATREALDESEEQELLGELKGLRKGSQRIVLQKLLQGGMLRADPEAMAEWEELQRSFRPPENFRLKVVDVNRTCKGTRSGGLYRFSCMVVVGNGEGVLGWGQGKAAEVNSAITKAYMRACRNLYPIPRFNGHTIPERTVATFGKVKVEMYPKSAGNGVVASNLVREICKMAGIHDVGVKVHGSRNPRNTVKCLFEAFDKMRTHDEITSVDNSIKVLVTAPPGKFGKLRVG